MFANGAKSLGSDFKVMLKTHELILIDCGFHLCPKIRTHRALLLITLNAMLFKKTKSIKDKGGTHMTEYITHCLYGNTNESSSVPSAESWPNTNLSDGGFTQKATATSINKSEYPTTPKAIHGFIHSLGLERTLTLQGLKKQFLADLFVVRNCYTNKPLFWSPLLLRFEAFDLLVSAEPDGTLSFWQGSVNTEKGLDYSPFSFIDKNELCPVWTNKTLLIKATGQQVLSACAKNKHQIKLDLDESYLHMIGSKDKKPVVRTMLYEKIDQCFT